MENEIYEIDIEGFSLDAFTKDESVTFGYVDGRFDLPERDTPIVMVLPEELIETAMKTLKRSIRDLSEEESRALAKQEIFNNIQQCSEDFIEEQEEQDCRVHYVSCVADQGIQIAYEDSDGDMRMAHALSPLVGLTIAEMLDVPRVYSQTCPGLLP